MIGCEVCGEPTRPWVLDTGNELDRCPRCGHVMRELRRCPAGARADSWGGDTGLDRVRLRLTYRRLRRAAGRPRRVFEAGYGGGGLLARFAADGSEIAGAEPGVLGVPVDPRVVATGRLFPGPVEQVPVDLDGTFDLVYAVHVAEHVADPVAFAARCARLLGPGGVLVWLTPTADSHGPHLFGSSWWMLEDPSHVRFFSEASVRLLLRDQGLADITVIRCLGDSLSVEAASLVRRLRGRGDRPGAGVLPGLGVRALSAAVLPVTLAARAVSPRLRPTLQVVARRPGPP